jgi:hypothetical protein
VPCPANGVYNITVDIVVAAVGCRKVISLFDSKGEIVKERYRKITVYRGLL